MGILARKIKVSDKSLIPNLETENDSKLPSETTPIINSSHTNSTADDFSSLHSQYGAPPDDPLPEPPSLSSATAVEINI